MENKDLNTKLIDFLNENEVIFKQQLMLNIVPVKEIKDSKERSEKIQDATKKLTAFLSENKAGLNYRRVESMNGQQDIVEIKELK